MFSIEIHFGWLRQVWLSSSYKMTCYINEYWFLCSEKNDCPIINNFLWLNTRKLNKKLLVNDAYLKFFFCFVYFSLHRLFLLLWFIPFNLFIHSFHTYVNFIHWKKIHIYSWHWLHHNNDNHYFDDDVSNDDTHHHSKPSSSSLLLLLLLPLWIWFK